MSDDANQQPEGDDDLIVKRGPLQDSAEWGSGEPPSTPFRRGPDAHTPEGEPIIGGPTQPPNPEGPFGSGQRPWALIGVMLAIVALAGVAIGFRQKPPPPIERPLLTTFADLAPGHAGVFASQKPVRVLERVGMNTPIETDANGRARLRLDTGTTVILDRSTKLTVTPKGVDLDSGRIFVVATPGTKVGIAGAVVTISDASAAFEKTTGDAKVYASNGELTVRAANVDSAVKVGETATIAGSKVTVAPERGFDDWTGGLATPWSVDGKPRRAIGEAWGRAQPGDPGSPLTVRAVNVDAKVTGEVARTEVETTFFNAGRTNVVGDFRIAIPRGALVARFATKRGNQVREGHIGLASRGGDLAPNFSDIGARGDILEWAGDGWLRGTIPDIAPGSTTTVTIAYVEWLTPTPKEGGTEVVEYRYPMVGESPPPLVGEFFARVDAGPSDPVALAAGMDAHTVGSAVEIRRSDFKPTADLVVDVEEKPAKSPARAYVANAAEDGDDPTIVVRTEVPNTVTGSKGSTDQGITVALVLDTSTSIDPALLDAGKAFVESVVRSLGPSDRVVVFAADQGVRAIGPVAIGSVDDARKKAVIDALGNVEQGGATDLGRSLEAAAAALPNDAPDAMVVYVGDGWPTIGDLTPEAIRARLARRAQGAPRLGAVAVGPSANRLVLAALTKGSGPLIEVADTEGAARASVELLENALVPTVTSVSLDLGPGVERVYPRSDQAVQVGTTITYVGTVRGDVPKNVVLTYRDASGIHHETRAVTLEDTAYPDDVLRRWAALRVESIALAGGGREATTDAALQSGLVTPWTALLVGGRSQSIEYVPTSLEARVLDTAVGPDLGFNAAFTTPRAAQGALAAPSDAARFEEEDYPVAGAIELSARRTLDDARAAFRSCRDTRAALRPELSGNVLLTFDLDGEGHASKVHAQGVNDNDETLSRCLELVVDGLAFARSETKDDVKVSYTVSFPPPDPSLRGRKCSPTSTLDLPLRRGVWRERIDRLSAANAYLDAKRSCELPNWTAKRSMLELILSTLGTSSFGGAERRAGLATLGIATSLEDAGDPEAAGFLRKEAIRRAAPEELAALRGALLSSERVPRTELDKQYAAAADDKGRLAVVARFLAFAPHSALLRKRQIELLASMGDKGDLLAAVRLVRLDPFADATLIAEGAHLLRKAGPDLEDEARRTYFEIAERGPNDPWGRAFLGDRLRAEGWFDDATESYEILDRLVPDDGATGIRLALAHAGAHRLDVALRILSRVEKTGGRSADKKAALIANRLAHLLIEEALAGGTIDAEEKSLLERRLADFPAMRGSAIFVVRAEGGADPLTVSLERGPDKAREAIDPDASFSAIGIYTAAIPDGDASRVLLSVRTTKGVPPETAPTVDVVALGTKKRALVAHPTQLVLSGDPVGVAWDGAALVDAPIKPAK